MSGEPLERRHFPEMQVKGHQISWRAEKFLFGHPAQGTMTRFPDHTENTRPSSHGSASVRVYLAEDPPGEVRRLLI
jgi:hypothetical protein